MGQFFDYDRDWGTGKVQTTPGRSPSPTRTKKYFDYDRDWGGAPEAAPEKSIFEKAGDLYTDYVQPVLRPAMGALNVAGASVSQLVAGETDAYQRALAENQEFETIPGVTGALLQAPGLGQVGMEALMPGKREGFAQVAKSTAGLVGDILTDPFTYATGGLAGASKALKAGKPLQAASRVLGSAPAGLVYAPEVARGAIQGAEQAWQGAEEHGIFSEEALAPALQTAVMGGLGGLMAKGAVTEVREFKAQRAAAEETQRAAAARGEAPPPKPVAESLARIQQEQAEAQALAMQQQVRQVQGEVVPGRSWEGFQSVFQRPGVEEAPIDAEIIPPGGGGQRLLPPPPPGLPPAPGGPGGPGGGPGDPRLLPPGPGELPPGIAGLLPAPRVEEGPGVVSNGRIELSDPTLEGRDEGPVSPPPASLPRERERFYHLSDTPDIQQLSPEEATARSQFYSEERAREERVPRVNLYREGTAPEARLANLPERYEGEFPEGSKIYDLQSDPQGFIQQGLRGTELERAVVDAGFSGMEHEGSVAYFGEALPVRRPGVEMAREEKLATAPRGEEQMVPAPLPVEAQAPTPKPPAPAPPEGQLPLDRVPKELRQESGDLAKGWAEKFAEVGKIDDLKFEAELPAHLKPHAQALRAQVVLHASALIGGKDLVDRLREYHPRQGADGIEVIRSTEDSDSFDIVQRAGGEIVGGAEVRGGKLAFIAGGKGMKSPVSAKAIYETIDRLGVERDDTLTILGAQARRGYAQRVERESGTGLGREVPGPVREPAARPQDPGRVRPPLQEVASPEGLRTAPNEPTSPAAEVGPPATAAPAGQRPLFEDVSPSRLPRAGQGSSRERLQARGDAALKRMQERGAQVTANLGADPALLGDLVDYGASRIAVHGMDFAKWSADMVGQFGEGIRQHLKEVWKKAQKFNTWVQDQYKQGDE